MSLLSDFYTATPANALQYDVNRNLEGSDRAEFSGLTYNELADLWAILQNSERNQEHATAFESVLVVGGGERLINRFPPEFVALLASLDAAMTSNAASKWVKTGELAYMSCEPSDVVPIVEAAARLARIAQRSGKSLYLWMCV